MEDLKLELLNACKAWDGKISGVERFLECQVGHRDIKTGKLNSVTLNLEGKNLSVYFYPSIGNITSIELRNIDNMAFSPEYRDMPLEISSKDKKIIIHKEKDEMAFVDLVL